MAAKERGRGPKATRRRAVETETEEGHGIQRSERKTGAVEKKRRGVYQECPCSNGFDSICRQPAQHLEGTRRHEKSGRRTRKKAKGRREQTKAGRKQKANRRRENKGSRRTGQKKERRRKQAETG